MRIRHSGFGTLTLALFKRQNKVKEKQNKTENKSSAWNVAKITFTLEDKRKEKLIKKLPEGLIVPYKYIYFFL